MAHLLPFVFSFSLVAALAAQSDRRREGRNAPVPEIKLEHFVYEEVEMESPSVRMGVYLPRGHADEASADERYPWVVWLHGRNESHHKFHRDGGARVLDELRGKGEIPELVFVALTLGNPIYVDTGRGVDQEKLITERLPAFLAEKYRVKNERTARAVMGVSMGGFGALKIAMRHPDLFATVAAHSSALMPADPESLQPPYQRQVQRMVERGGLDAVFGNPIDKEKWAQHMPLALAASMDTEELSRLAIYFDAGTEDRYGFGPPNQKLHEVLKERGVPHEFELVQGGGHSWGSGSLQKQLVKSLTFVGKRFVAAEAASTGTAAPAAGDKASAEAGR
ncbi:MAG TPA: alpha/beta hydrolase-fold protein [Planctomycetota bacterium]|nr:alpha/beta hydrolase-fold protein [Planctomycetota bacterium]